MVTVDRTAEGFPSLPALPRAGAPRARLVDSAGRDAGDAQGGWLVSAAAQRPPRKEPLEPGRSVAGRYLVRRVLGQGGMGQVLEVEHVALGRAFALKVLRLERWNDELVRRFNREARALARVTSPRVAQVTDFGVDEDVGPFYVMELLEGETLEDRLERDERVPPQGALAICAELCEALAEVHAAGIVHRDLKPSNVGLPRSGPVGVKLLDFGLAASMDDAFLSKITQSQQILGSLPYMAPEQFNSAEPAPAMDVYAVGVVLYESLVGRLPFFAPSTAAMIHQILSTPPPPLPFDLPGRDLLEPLLERLLAKEASQRFASAAAAGHALREACAVLGGPVAKAHPVTRAAGGGALPPTAEAKAMAPMAFMPTVGMPESGPVAESGTRLSSHVAPPGVTSPVGPLPMHGPPPPYAGTHPGPPTLPGLHAPPARGWPIPWLLVGGLGIVLSAAAGVAVVVLLSLLGEGEREAAAPPPAPVIVPAPVVTAVPPPQVAPEPGNGAADGAGTGAGTGTGTADGAGTGAGTGAGAGAGAGTGPDEAAPAAPPAEVPVASPALRPRPSPRVETQRPPQAPPPIYVPPQPPPRSPGSSGGNDGIIRQW